MCSCRVRRPTPHPAFSPDGQYLAYWSAVPGAYSLMVADSDGTHAEAVSGTIDVGGHRQVEQASWALTASGSCSWVPDLTVRTSTWAPSTDGRPWSYRSGP